MEPLLQYIDKVYEQCQPNEVITVVVPEFVPNRRWQHLLHTQAALTLRLALRSRPGIVVTDVPYQYEPSRYSNSHFERRLRKIWPVKASVTLDQRGFAARRQRDPDCDRVLDAGTDCEAHNKQKGAFAGRRH
jgi:hypothetical protein